MSRRVALISPWRSRCGIAVYAGDVYRQVRRHRVEVKVFACDEPCPCQSPEPAIAVENCWRMGEPPPWKLAIQIARFHPDLIHVQHEFGYFHPPEIWDEWLACLRSIGKPVVVTYHSVPELPNPETDVVVDAAIVPSPVGAALLRSRLGNLVCNVQHAVDGAIPVGNLREANSLATFGFLWHSKGYGRTLRAIAALRGEIPDLSLSILGSLADRVRAEQVDYFESLLREIHDAGLADRVDVCCGFRLRHEVNQTLQRKRVAVLHYDRTDDPPQLLDAATTISGKRLKDSRGPACSTGGIQSYGNIRAQSAALFTHWSAGLPCIVSNAERFDVTSDLEPALIRAPDGESLTQAIRWLCTDAAAYRDAQQRIVDCVRRNWENVADEHLQIFAQLSPHAFAG